MNDRLIQAHSKSAAAKWQPRSPDELRNLTALPRPRWIRRFPGRRCDGAGSPFDENRAQPRSFTPAQMMSKLESFASAREISEPADRADGGARIRRASGTAKGCGELKGAHSTSFRGAAAADQAALPPPEPAMPDPEPSPGAGDFRAGNQADKEGTGAEFAAFAELDSLGVARRSEDDSQIATI